METGSLTLRADQSLIRALKDQAKRNERSVNRELTVILRAALKEEKASGK